MRYTGYTTRRASGVVNEDRLGLSEYNTGVRVSLSDASKEMVAKFGATNCRRWWQSGDRPLQNITSQYGELPGDDETNGVAIRLPLNAVAPGSTDSATPH